MTISERLADQTVLAVGCGSPDGQTNNGLAAARAFARAGASVCIVDRDQSAIDHTVAAIKAVEPKGRIATALADVTDESQVEHAVAECTEALGTPSVLYYNVGIVISGGPVELPVDRFKLALDINLTGAFTAIKHVLPGMLEMGRGSIVTVSSVGGMKYLGYDYPAYAASKAGLIELTNSVALSCAHRGIRANSIAPGFIETPLIRGAAISDQYSSIDEMLAARHAASPTGRMGTPEDVAAVAVFLASKESAYVNATTIPVDGGVVSAFSTGN